MTRRRRVRRRHAVALFLALGLLVVGAIWQNVRGVGDEVTGTLHNFARAGRAARRPAAGPADRGQRCWSRRRPTTRCWRPRRRPAPRRRWRPARRPRRLRRATPKPAARQRRRQPVQAPREPLHQRGVRPRLVCRRRDADGPRDARQGTADACVPEGARGADRGVGEPARQPERRLGPVGDGRGARGVWRRTATRSAPTRRRGDALNDAARAISKTHAPVILLAWRGAHTWVMTGYRADADPLVFEQREGQRRLHPRPVVPAGVLDLGPVRPARHVPDMRRHAAQLPALEAARGQLPGPRRPVHRRRPDEGQQELAPLRRRRPRPPRLYAGSRAQSATRARRPAATVRTASPAANPSGIATTPTTFTSASVVDDGHDEPGQRRDDGQHRVVRRVQAAREQVAQRIERDRERERGEHRRRERDVLGVERAAAEQDLDRERADDHEHRSPRAPTPRRSWPRSSGPAARTPGGRRPPRRRTASGTRRARWRRRSARPARSGSCGRS